MRTYTVAQILAAEEHALAAQGQLPLMLRAATAVALTAVAQLARPLPGRRVVLLVGSGNNGGDALYAGANLARRGIRVTAVLTDPSRVHAGGLAALRRGGGHVVPFVLTGTDVPALLGAADLIIDGLVGIGATPPLRPAAGRLAELANASPATRLAVDIPSGVDPDDGHTDGPAIRADITVTFGGAKTGLLLSDNAGQVRVHALEFPLDGGPYDTLLLTDAEADALIPTGSAESDKYRNGVVGIAAGSAQYPGAAVLCVGGAVRLRPGMVRYAGTGKDAVLARWPEVVAAETVESAGRVQAWVVGPGIGTDDSAGAAGRDSTETAGADGLGRSETAEAGGRDRPKTAFQRLEAVMASDVPVLVDADGLTLLSRHPDLLERRRDRVTVLTPHAGEFARLFPDVDLQRRLPAVRAAAARSGAVVLLKGHRSVVAHPDGRAAINTTGTPWLASAGSGDVLSGVVGSLLAAGLEPLTAAAAGAYVHGRAGERAQAAGLAGAQTLWDHLR
jgi:ADP-dependent NAD(P)H-hydrate dehydratase / NAD(P)H-hydrate epimerase